MHNHRPRIAICYKSTRTGPYPTRTGGLAANANHSVKVLKNLGYEANAYCVDNVDEVHDIASRYTHVVIEAVWMRTFEVEYLAKSFPKVQFAIRAHSKIGFLQVEPEAVTVAREIIASGVDNVVFSSNNHDFASSLSEIYGHVKYLPNLYYLGDKQKKRAENKGVLKIASFGASRLLKLHPNAALAALQVSRRLGCPLEFYINTDRTPGGESVRKTMRNMFAGLKHAKLVELGWQNQEEFRQTIAEMDLVFQLSASETFCLVAADAVAAGVPILTSPAVSWNPGKYQVDADNAAAATEAAIEILGQKKRTAKAQFLALCEYLVYAVVTWHNWLEPHKK